MVDVTTADVPSHIVHIASLKSDTIAEHTPPSGAAHEHAEHPREPVISS
jgi:hypothetical protein